MTAATARVRVIRVRWDAVVTVIAALMIGLAIGMSAATQMVDSHIDSRVPRCTDAIADAKGICWGEPLPGE